MRNARFWTVVNNGPVKVTLKPGQSLSHRSGGAHDEGFCLHGVTWEYSGEHGTVGLFEYERGRDCDGPHSASYESECPLDRLCDRELYGFDELEFTGIRLPEWEPLEAEQHDEYAEAMGY